MKRANEEGVTLIVIHGRFAPVFFESIVEVLTLITCSRTFLVKYLQHWCSGDNHAHLRMELENWFLGGRSTGTADITS
jgi:hypothetical protein